MPVAEASNRHQIQRAHDFLRMRGHAVQLRYIRQMKSATIPSVRVDPEFRAEVEAVLADGESLSEFVEDSIRASVERRRFQVDFIARGLRSRDAARLTGDYVEADDVVARLQQKLDAARARLVKPMKAVKATRTMKSSESSKARN